MCAWCNKVKPLARTGRLPRFCCDWCRRQPAIAESALIQARWQLESAQRTIAYLEDKLERFHGLEPAETIQATAAAGNASGRTDSGDAGAAETIPPAAAGRNSSGVAIAALTERTG